MTLSNSFQQRLARLSEAQTTKALKHIRHGIEREALRVDAKGNLARTPHPKGLGSALTHGVITTDFSESLLEFITPPEEHPETTLAQLQDIHKFALSQMGGEGLWPTSMPCFVDSEDAIPIGYYGSSNIGKMKSLYRQGLKHRYGSMMQTIAGVHCNFSLPQVFWQCWLGDDASQANIDDAYFGLIRRYQQQVWLIPYLFGASPALCKSFLQGKETAMPFKVSSAGCYYLPYATSLRMSDLGYTNHAQASLNISYDGVGPYVQSLRRAIKTPSQAYRQFSAGEGGEYQQLNHNVLQIENELYSAIRPKQPTARLEKPTDALAARGVAYIEVRALDVNPFSAVGISQGQIDFLDVFLLTCLLQPSPSLDQSAQVEAHTNLTRVVERGREPGLTLLENGQETPLVELAETLFGQMKEVARVLDRAQDTQRFSQAVQHELAKVSNPGLTLSAQLLEKMLEKGGSITQVALSLKEAHQQALSALPFQHFSAQDFHHMAVTSVAKQQELEAADKQSFDAFLREYFARAEHPLAE